jgi:transcriptional regulator with XRE-family HTH domain
VFFEDFMLIIHERIKSLRKKNKITQKKMADFLDVDEVTFQRYEYGIRRPSLDLLVALADYFDVSMDYLIGRSNDPKKY